jgi:diacylglycerol kinase family enzyme
MTSVVLIVNPHAGCAKPRLPEIEATLQDLGVAFRTVETTSLDHGRELATQASNDGDTVLSLGGDGLVGALAGAVSDAGGLLGVLPGGRGNDFGRVLGVPEDGAE